MSFLSFPKRLSDDEYVEKLRRSMAFWSRWRYVMVIANVGLVVAFGAVVKRVVLFVMNMAIPPGNAPVNWPLAGFVCGAALGMALGWVSWQFLQQLMNVIGGFRSERLLLKYYDACEALRTGQVASGHGGSELVDSSDAAELLPDA